MHVHQFVHVYFFVCSLEQAEKEWGDNYRSKDQETCIVIRTTDFIHSWMSEISQISKFAEYKGLVKGSHTPSEIGIFCINGR